MMTLSLCCFAIIILIETGAEPNGPPPATPGLLSDNHKSVMAMPKAGVKRMRQDDGPKRTQKGDHDNAKKRSHESAVCQAKFAQ